jgi:3-hydroxybutyryl-CoA dehydratase
MVIHVNELDGYNIEDLEIGMRAIFAKTVTEADIVLFAAASGDNNAIHINEEFARTTTIQGPHRPRHAVAERYLRGDRRAPAGAGHDLYGPESALCGAGSPRRYRACHGHSRELIPEKCRVRLSTICIVKGEMVVDGEALVMTTSRKARES